MANLDKYIEEKPYFFKRIIWRILNLTIFRMLISSKLFRLRNSLLRLFGAKIHKRCMIYASSTIFAPWNLEVGYKSCIGPNVNIYNKSLVSIGRNSVLSQGSHICTASHDIESPTMRLVNSNIIIGNEVWVCAEAFIGPGVKISEGSVVGARAVLFKNVSPWEVWCGNPAIFVKKRLIRNDQ